MRNGLAGLLLAAAVTACGTAPGDNGGGGGGGGGGTSGSAIAVATGEFHSLVLLDDGTVLSWGYNNRHQLGDGSVVAWRDTPVAVVGPTGEGVLEGITAIAAGRRHSLALTSDGQIYAWGENEHGQLGIIQEISNVPRPVHADHIEAEIVAIAAGQNTSFAIDADGGLWAWGANSHHALGEEDSTGREFPGLVAGLPPASRIATSGSNVFVITRNDGVWAWGSGYNHGLGTGTAEEQPEPVRIDALNGYDITRIAAGWDYTLALLEDGTVLGWGRAIYPGDSASPGSTLTEPTEITGLSGIDAIAVTGATSAVIGADGVPRTWGSNVWGILGTGSEDAWSGAPTGTGLTGIEALSSSGIAKHFLALGANGTVWAWGWNAHLQIGDGNPDEQIRRAPMQITLP